MYDPAPPSAGEVRALAHQLLSWADHLAARPEPGREMSEEDRHDLVLNLAVAAREARFLRSTSLSGAMLGDPRWDVLLDVFIQELRGFSASIDALALSGHWPEDVLAGAVSGLAELGILERAPLPFDTGVDWVSLTAPARRSMFDIFEQAAEFVRPVAGRPDA